MKRILLSTIIVTSTLAFGAYAFNQETRRTPFEGVTLSGKTLTLKRGYRFRRVAPGRVAVVDSIGNAEGDLLCLCDPDSDDGRCAFKEVAPGALSCEGCSDCDVHSADGSVGDGKLQTESPSGSQSSPIQSSEAGAQGDSSDRLARCEERSRQLAAELAALNRRPGTGDASGAAQSTSGSYERVWLRAYLNTQMQVLVDGRPVAMYSRLTQQYLDSLLKRGSVNRITFVFSGHAPGNKVELHVKPPGDEKLRQVFSFSPEAGKLEESFEVAFAGKSQ